MTEVKDKFGSGIDRAAQRFLLGVEKYLDDEESTHE
jgi:hypothetical protein